MRPGIAHEGESRLRLGRRLDQGQGDAPLIEHVAPAVGGIARDAVDQEAEGTQPDLIYRLPDGNVAVFLAEADEDGATHNDSDYEALRDLGWGVIIIGADADWEAVVTRYPSVFGSHRKD